MEFKKLIEARRSVRGYREGISHDDLAESPEALEKARQALPSFNQNSSASAALVVTTFVRDTVGFTQGQPDNEVGNGWGAYDLGLHDAYLVLAAADMGYDTLIMGLRDADALRKVLEIPENEQVMSVIAVGRRAKEPVTKPRKPLEETARFF